MVHDTSKEMPLADDPPYSRIFVLYSKKEPISEETFKNTFSKFGQIQNIFIVRDRVTNEDKGVTYIKYSKMSEAALAVDKMAGTLIDGHSSSVRVFIAKSRSEGKGDEKNDPEKFLKLFIIFPKTASERQVLEYFEQFGTIDSFKLLKDRETNESRGIGYLKYTNSYSSARAIEEASKEPGYKATIARPKEGGKQVTNNDGVGAGAGPGLGLGAGNNFQRTRSLPPPHGNASLNSISPMKSEYQTCEEALIVTASSLLGEEQLARLFSIAPSFKGIRYYASKYGENQYIVTYNTPEAAHYALNKLNGLEYPLGEFIRVSMHQEESDISRRLDILSRALLEANALLKDAGLSTASLDAIQQDSPSGSRHCNFPLPPPRNPLPPNAFDEESGERLFFTGRPSIPPPDVLRDVFCRFGDFVNINILSNKNCGFANFASHESAFNAMDTLHDKVISGMTMKVVVANPKSANKNKRQRTE